MEDCITISDDEDIEMIRYVVNLEPIVIDISDSDSEEGSQSQRPSRYQQQEPPSPRHDQASDSDDNDEEQTEDSPEQSQSEFNRSQPFRSSQPPPSQQQQEHHHHHHHHPWHQSQRQPSQSPQPSTQPKPQSQQRMPQQPQYQQDTYPQPQQSQQQQPEKQPESKQTEKSENVDIGKSNDVGPQMPPPDENPIQDEAPKQAKPKMSDHELMITLKNLGNQKYKNNVFDDAIRTYKRANELAVKLEDKEMSAILHFNLAMTYFRVGSFDQAADECARAVKLNDKYMKAHLKRAEIYQRQRKFDEAVICYEHICELDSTNQDYIRLLNHSKECAKQTRKKDYYQILGLNSNFTREDLKKAYRQQALSHHPDRHSDADIVTRRIQEKHFKDASEAHSFIQVRLNGR